MSATEGSQRRFLIEVRGMFAVAANTGEAALGAVEDWIAAVARNEAPGPESKSGLSVRWLRIEPESEENRGWPPPELLAEKAD